MKISVARKIEKWGRTKEVVVRRNKEGCLICVSHAADSDGYPRVTVDYKGMTLIRKLYIDKYGLPEKGLVLRHSCDNRRCVNLDHISLGLPRDNTQDMVLRGRGCKGELHHWSVLREGDVKEIKKGLLAGKSVSFFAKKYGVNYYTIWYIRKGKHWRYVNV